MAGASGREFGRIDLNAIGATTDEPWLTWRYSILPQLVENLLAAGAEELLDPQTREAWLDANRVESDVAAPLAPFDSFLEGMGIVLRITGGRGLGRTLLILDATAAEVDEEETSDTESDGQDDADETLSDTEPDEDG